MAGSPRRVSWQHEHHSTITGLSTKHAEQLKCAEMVPDRAVLDDVARHPQRLPVEVRWGERARILTSPAPEHKSQCA
jgi:hypothetical protein